MTATHQTPMTALQQIDAHPLTRNQRSLIGLAITGNIAEFFDMFLIGFVISYLVKPWHLTGLESGVILACSGLGTVAGAIMWGRLADMIGRKASFRWCVILFVGFTALSVFTPDRGWLLLAILRIGVGIGVGGLNITSIPYVQEFVPAAQRGLLAGLASVFIPLGLFLGSMAQAWLGDIIGWRGLIGLGVIPIFLLAWLAKVPESPRFLQLKGRTDEAKEALAWALQMPVENVGALPEVTTTKGMSYGQVISRHLRPLTIVTLGSFCFILGSFTVQSWGQTLLKEGYGYSLSTVGYLFMGVSLADLLGRLASAWLADRIGRRWTMFSFGMMGAVGAVIAATSTSGTMFFVGVVIIMGFGDGAFGILNAFGAEQFPNEARSTGLGLGYGLGAMAKVVGPALMGIIVGGDMLKQNVTTAAVPPAFFLFAALLVMGSIIYLFAQETKGKSLDSI
ncbi:putative niacin/nicotinamide transporter NaiP [Austwickia sp. TVS 96-490-7B]|uniref:MFS transporter n=1 Tax=Austwickia sp. TVS 96-490-7B TaxID=2830843 RepID=UPI001C59B883|nr:MFS transporter [Austwickia sp. TVS 96-490-7B]MBW3084618.1 putative niacin/nicotinamide transporter NaiP [Austwickia sp. TVS 96-490-7B]